MKKVIRWLWSVSLLLILASFATAFLGVRYAVSQIPQEVRDRMSDTDWVGVEWIVRALLLQGVSVLLALSAIVLWIIQKRRDRHRQPGS